MDDIYTGISPAIPSRVRSILSVLKREGDDKYFYVDRTLNRVFIPAVHRLQLKKAFAGHEDDLVSFLRNLNIFTIENALPLIPNSQTSINWIPIILSARVRDRLEVSFSELFKIPWFILSYNFEVGDDLLDWNYKRFLMNVDYKDIPEFMDRIIKGDGTDMYESRSRADYNISAGMAFDRLNIERKMMKIFSISVANLSNEKLNRLAQFVNDRDDAYNAMIEKNLSSETSSDKIKAFYDVYDRQIADLRAGAQKMLDEQQRKWKEKNFDDSTIQNGLKRYTETLNSAVYNSAKEPKDALEKVLERYRVEFVAEKLSKMRVEIKKKIHELLNEPDHTDDNWHPTEKIQETSESVDESIANDPTQNPAQLTDEEKKALENQAKIKGKKHSKIQEDELDELNRMNGENGVDNTSTDQVGPKVESKVAEAEDKAKEVKEHVSGLGSDAVNKFKGLFASKRKK